jgi:2-dehydro-3-deoxy-D-gluconate 5-dehydrogenase
MTFSGQVALVTGASRGVGRALAIALAERGADVACAARATDVARQRLPGTIDETVRAVEARGRRGLAVPTDLSRPGEPEAMVARTLETFGRIDILVNNAGTIRRAPAVDYSEEDWTTVIEVNLSAVFRLSQAAGRVMLKQGSGKIINIASLLSFQGGITVPAYAASKGGVAQLTKALANEWAGKGINVNAIAPGYMRTDNTRALQQDETRNRQILERIPAGRWGEPSDLAGAAVFLASSASDYVNGEILVVDGGWMGR